MSSPYTLSTPTYQMKTWMKLTYRPLLRGMLCPVTAWICIVSKLVGVDTFEDEGEKECH